MAEIFNFPKPDPLYFVCGCNCQSFRVLETGHIECANCKHVHNCHTDDDPGEWVKKYVSETPAVAKRDDEGTTTVTAIGSVDLARAYVLKYANNWAKANELSIIVAYNKDGEGKQWLNINNQEEKDWVIGKLKALLEFSENINVSE